MKLHKTALAGFLLVGSLALTGCTVNVNTADSHQGMMDQTDTSEYSRSDIMFAQMMIPHHQQAVDMGTLAETRASNPKVKALAAQIKAEQAPEIETMKGWLDTANASLDMGHDMGMDGMLTDDEFEALKNSTGAEFDKLYLEGMINHHGGAISMAVMVMHSKNANVKAMSAAILASQVKEVKYMQQLLKDLG